VISALAIRHGLIPANTGMSDPDPRLPLCPVATPVHQPIRSALVNSLGFGGNNAVAVLGETGSGSGKPINACRYPQALSILANACLTGAGDLDATADCFRQGESVAGQFSTAALSASLPAKTLRRLKRLPRMVLSLCETVRRQVDLAHSPGSVYLGTGWGALTETHRFLTQLFESDQRFASPIDFSGSVHNAPAGQAAIFFNATGPNMTLTGGDYSFEQALFTAALLTKKDDQPCIVIGADEYHPDFSPLFDPSCHLSNIPSDGGAAFCLQQAKQPGHPTLRCLFYARAKDNRKVISNLVAAVDNHHTNPSGYNAILYGIPECYSELGHIQLEKFSTTVNREVPCIPYRLFTGEFATASAVATSLAVTLVRDQTIPATLTGTAPIILDGRGILILGLGTYISAILVSP
jgi:3-oxoacyl-[acyl-carrier-protein] synthase-1/3-oxoacyl-[acyl-carrier-protein] synthase II